MASKELHASGRLREIALAWWRANHRSKVTKVLVKADGYLRFHWSDGNESGSFSLPIETLFHAQ